MVKGKSRLTESQLALFDVQKLDELPPGFFGPSRDAKRNKLQLLPFTAWDGEGYTKNGTHHYMLFGNSEGQYIEGRDLKYHECFDLMLSSGAANHVIYGGDYDIIMMTRTMPHGVLKRLLHGLPVRHDGFRMQWFRKKYLMLSDGERRITLYDVMTFFQTSFVKACREFLGDSPALDEMQVMKLARDSFTKDDDRVIPYWQSELQYLVDLMDTLRTLLQKVGIQPKGWHGPGAVAGALLTAHHMGNHIPPQPTKIVDLAERAYYGGRFEQFQTGVIDGVHEYDIRSAYPSAIAQLPSLVDCTWHHTNDIERIHKFGLYCVSWNLYKQTSTPIGMHGPFPWRNRMGNIYYPLQGYRSWYWGIEVGNLRFLPKDSWEIHEGYVPNLNHVYPFNWVQRMYDQRAAMKAVGNPAQLAMKLGLNSLYGKLAQSKGAKFKNGRWIKPRWHQMVYAGWITAYTRRRIFEALIQAKGNAIAVETDAIFTRSPLGLPISDRLGDWENTWLDRILYVDSGVYYALNEGVWKIKSRGVEVDRTKSADYWLEIFGKLPQEKVEITASMRRFGTVLNSKHYSNWYDFDRTTTLPSMSSKRIHYPAYCRACLDDRSSTYAERAHDLTVPDPILDADITMSTPYAFPWRDDVSWQYPEDWTIREVDPMEMDVSWL